VRCSVGRRDRHRSRASRRRGRERNEGSRNRLPEQLPFRQPSMRFNHTEVLSADEVEAIHEASLTILERIGMEFLDGEARSIMREAGAIVDESTQRVRFPRELVEQSVAKAPSEFTLHSWNPDAQRAHRRPLDDLRHRGQRAALRRPSTACVKTGDREGYQDLLKLAQMLNIGALRRVATRSSRSTSTRRSATSRRATTSSRSPTRASTATASAGSATSTASRWFASPAASTRPSSTASRRS
jgi:trimethylamine:corrinoid methyltransferase-like protein